MAKKIFKKIFSKIGLIVSGLFWYGKDIFLYRKMLRQESAFGKLYLFPQLFDKHPSAHTFDKHYVYMDRWAFKQIAKNRPAEHIDVGSSIRFLSMVSSAVRTKFVDIRPIKLDFDNFECIAGSILNLPFQNDSVSSLSCLHVTEHIGLGRYGDPLDPFGTQKACKELARILAPGGMLYFALPVGRQATYFNAHRVHNPESILSYFPTLRLLQFAAVNDAGRFVEPANPKNFLDSSYACGMYLFTK